MHAILLAGGKGTRLWPLSKANTPKQLLAPLNQKESLLEMTINRTKSIGFDPKNIYLLTTEEQVPMMSPIWNNLGEIIAEPKACNTAPAILLAIKKLIHNGVSSTEPIYVFPTDAHMTNFQPNLALCLEDMILCYRIVPTRIETSYGYIQPHTGGIIRKVRHFKEKPDLETATKWFNDWKDDSIGEEEKYFWNSGIYGFTIKSLSEALEQIDPELYKFWNNSSYEEFYEKFDSLPKLPFDKLIAEKAYNLHSAPLPADSWRDIGSWESIHASLKTEENQNISLGEGNVIFHDSKSCLVSSDKKFNIVCGDLDNITVIVKDDNILIIDKKNPNAMAKLVEELKVKGLL